MSRFSGFRETKVCPRGRDRHREQDRQRQSVAAGHLHNAGQPRDSGEFREGDARTVTVPHELDNRLQQHPIARRRRDPGAAVTMPPG
jgi:hypothetical protein